MQYLATYGAGARSRLVGRFVCIRLRDTSAPVGHCDSAGTVRELDKVGLLIDADAVGGSIATFLPWSSIERVELGFVDDDPEAVRS